MERETSQGLHVLNGHVGQDVDSDEDLFDAEDVEEVLDLDNADEDDDGVANGRMDTDSDEKIDSDFDKEAEAPIPDPSTAHFASHSPKSLFCISAHPVTPLLCVSGGEDDLAYLWRTDTGGEEIARLEGHTDSVTSVAFSVDGELVATGGMDSMVRVWKRVAPVAAGGAWEWAHWEPLASLEASDEVVWILWHPKGPVLSAGCNDGLIWLWNLPSGRNMAVLSSHTAPSTAGAWVPPSEGKRLLTSAEDSTLLLWDPKSPSSPPILRFSPDDQRFALEGGIHCLAVNTIGTLALVGGLSSHGATAEAGGLRIVNLVNGSIVGALASDGTHTADAGIEAVAWVDLAPLGLWLSAGTDGKLCAWDGASGRLRWQSPSGENGHSDAISSLAVARDGQSLVTASADRTVRRWDARSGRALARYTGHRDVVHAVALSADGRAVLSGGDDGIGRVYPSDPA